MGHGYSYEVDVWSIGVILYTLLIGTPPFETDNVADTYDLIKKNKYTFSESVAIPEQAKILIGHILQKDPSKRPTLDGILESSFMKAGKPKILKELSNVSVTRCSDSEPYPMSPTPLDCQPPQNIQVT
jgi:polo-like kinase 1